jgi:hypothetical protein
MIVNPSRDNPCYKQTYWGASLICKHRQAYSEHRGKPPHEYCDECAEISLPPSHSDSWICCVCGNLTLRPGTKRLSYNEIEKRRRIDEPTTVCHL